MRIALQLAAAYAAGYATPVALHALALRRDRQHARRWP